jgi:TP901-1 family phage major tail protein|tara:strand:+ start:92 stop:499 length:408 start_codon:yes stop_codon:yes gene_type:complete
MAAQKGAALLLKINTTGSTYVTVGGLRSTSITLNDESVDVTNKDSSGNRTLLADAGVFSMSVSGSGVFTDATTEETMRVAMNATTFKNFQILIPDLGTYTGAFMVSSLEYAGEYNGEVTYSVSLESSGAIAYAAV